MFCGVWSYSRGNPCGGFAKILWLFPGTLLPVRQSFTTTGGHACGFRGFKFIFNKIVFSTYQNLLYWCYKNTTPKYFLEKKKKTVFFFYSKVSHRDFSFSILPFTCEFSLIGLVIGEELQTLKGCPFLSFFYPLSMSGLQLKVSSVFVSERREEGQKITKCCNNSKPTIVVKYFLILLE